MSGVVHLGIDIGGTASRWVTCDAAGTVVSRGSVAGATGHVFNPLEAERLRAAFAGIATALGQPPASVTAGITGFGAAASDAVRALAATVFGIPAGAVLAMDDIVLAYLDQFAPGEGHLISAGTGTIGVHVGADGVIVRVGGRGILIDDAGSGSWIALRAIDGLYRVLDRQGDFAGAERLAHHFAEAVGGPGWSDMRQFIYGADRGRIGALAVAVARAAEEGDPLALSVLEKAGAELALLAQALIARAGDHPVRLLGGVLALHPVVLETMTASLPGRDVARGEADAALAAARLAHNLPWRDWLARHQPQL
jgi:N-acetylglucosamine kinase-like BadF-type ATPase